MSLDVMVECDWSEGGAIGGLIVLLESAPGWGLHSWIR